MPWQTGPILRFSAAISQSWLPTPRYPTAIESYENIYSYRARAYVEQYGFAATGNMAVRKHVFQSVGPFGGISTMEDTEWGQRATAMGHRIIFLPEAKVLTPSCKSFADLAPAVGPACRPRLPQGFRSPFGDAALAGRGPDYCGISVGRDFQDLEHRSCFRHARPDTGARLPDPHSGSPRAPHVRPGVSWRCRPLHRKLESRRVLKDQHDRHQTFINISRSAAALQKPARLISASSRQSSFNGSRATFQKSMLQQRGGA